MLFTSVFRKNFYYFLLFHLPNRLINPSVFLKQGLRLWSICGDNSWNWTSNASRTLRSNFTHSTLSTSASLYLNPFWQFWAWPEIPVCSIFCQWIDLCCSSLVETFIKVAIDFVDSLETVVAVKKIKLNNHKNVLNL